MFDLDLNGKGNQPAIYRGQKIHRKKTPEVAKQYTFICSSSLQRFKLTNANDE